MNNLFKLIQTKHHEDQIRPISLPPSDENNQHVNDSVFLLGWGARTESDRKLYTASKNKCEINQIRTMIRVLYDSIYKSVLAQSGYYSNE